MRILAIANLPPFVLGGAENQVARLVEAWVGLGHHVEVAGHRLPSAVVPVGGRQVVAHRIAVPARLGRVGRGAGYFLSLARLLVRRKADFDVVYCRGLVDAAISVCLMKALGLVRLPVVACPINARGRGDARTIRTIPGWRRLVRVIDRHCDAINVIAPAIEDDLREIGIRRPRLTRIPNGISIGSLAAREHVGSPRRLVFVGRLTAQKGLDVLLDALHRLRRERRDFVMDVFGEGPESASLRARSGRLHLGPSVVFRGAIAAEGVRRELASADLLVLPSRYEGMSNAALEGMEAALPVVLTRCGGIDAYVGSDVGWVCEPADAGELAAAVRAALDVPAEELLRMGRNARKLVRSRFEIGEVARQNAELFQSLCGHGTAQRVP